jgi:hypothetical protein
MTKEAGGRRARPGAFTPHSAAGGIGPPLRAGEPGVPAATNAPFSRRHAPPRSTLASPRALAFHPRVPPSRRATAFHLTRPRAASSSLPSGAPTRFDSHPGSFHSTGLETRPTTYDRPRLPNWTLVLRAHFKTDVLPYDGLGRRLPRPSFPEDFHNRRPWKAIVQGFETASSH